MKRVSAILGVGAVCFAVTACGAEQAPDDATGFRCAPGGGAGVVGLSDLFINGNAKVLAGSAESDIFSNGDIELMGDITIEGDAVAGGNVIEMGYAIDISGESLSGAGTIAVSIPYEEAEAAKLDNDNASIPATYLTSDNRLVMKSNQTLTLPGGTYFFSEINISGQAQLTFDGPTNIYVDGPVSISGGAHTTSSNHWEFNLYSISTAPISFSGSSSGAMNIYAPLAEVKLSGTEKLTGTVLGDLVTVSGNASITTAGDAASFGKSCIPSLPD